MRLSASGAQRAGLLHGKRGDIISPSTITSPWSGARSTATVTTTTSAPMNACLGGVCQFINNTTPCDDGFVLHV